MKNDVTAYILAKLSGAAAEDDIIYSVCQKTGLGWKQAQSLVEQVKSQHGEEIEIKQMPLKSLLAFIFYVTGIALIVGPLIHLWVMLDVTRVALAFASGAQGVNAETALMLLKSRCALLSWFELPSIVFTMLVGIGIIAANLRYMSGVWETLFRKWNLYR